MAIGINTRLRVRNVFRIKINLAESLLLIRISVCRYKSTANF